MMKNMGIKGSANRQSVFIYQYGSMMAGLKILEFFVEIIRVCFKTQHLCAKRQCSKLRT